MTKSVKFKTANAPRLPVIPWLKQEEGVTKINPQYEEHLQELQMCRDLVQIGSSIMNIPLRLEFTKDVSGIRSACTDGRNIYIPESHPQRTLVTKHELAHIFFRSNIPLRLLYVENLLSQWYGVGTFLPQDLIQRLCFIINIFDDIRVNSLWGLVYPGDGLLLDDWYHNDVAPRMFAKAVEDGSADNVKDLITYIILITLRQPVKSLEWGVFEKDIQEAANNVYLQTFPACLLIVKQLLEKIIAKKLEENNKIPDTKNPTSLPDTDPDLQKALAEGGESSDAIDKFVERKRKLIQGMQKTREDLLSYIQFQLQPISDYHDDNAGFDYDSNVATPPRDVRAEEKELIEAEKNPALFLSQQAEKAVSEVSRIKTDLFNKPRVIPGAESREGVTFVWREFRGSTFTGELRLTPEGRRELDETKKMLLRIQGTRRYQTSPDGGELLTDVLLQQYIRGEPLDCYQEEARSPGFTLYVLIDMSASMIPSCEIINLLGACLRNAFNIPRVTLKMFGFQSTLPGIVTMYTFPKLAGGERDPGSDMLQGNTPLPYAIRALGNRLKGVTGERHLLILTDGVPTFVQLNSTVVNQHLLVNWTREALEDLRANQIEHHSFMLDFAMEEQKLNHMLGTKRWSNVEHNNAVNSVYEYAKMLVTNYIRNSS